MRSVYYFLLLLYFLLLSCCKDKMNVELIEIPVNLEKNSPLLLSEIAESITIIELELTDKSLINPEPINIKRIFLLDDNVIVVENEKILIFNIEGKFIRSIGSKGQGPGEYLNIRNAALDVKNQRLFVNGLSKIICYDLYGKCLSEFSIIQQNESFGSVVDINYNNYEIIIIVNHIGREDSKGLFNQSAVYLLNDEFQIIDSCTIRKIYEPTFFSLKTSEDYILYSDSTIYLSYPNNIVLTPEARAKNRSHSLQKTVLQDTLYRYDKNQLVPELKLKFKNDGLDGEGYLFIYLSNVYRSSRYIFSAYFNYSLDFDYFYPFFCFCYDTKTGKGYNMQDGYTDDFNQIDKPVKIRPFNNDTEMFYYLHTNMKPDDLEEPNPTLYIGRLKK